MKSPACSRQTASFTYFDMSLPFTVLHQVTTEPSLLVQKLELCETIYLMDNKELKLCQIDWKFNPPAVNHMGRV